MSLTRGDKMIIIGAVALAATVVVGLALLKKPRLFSGAAAPQPVAVAPLAAPPSPPTPVVVSPPPVSRPAPAAVVSAPPTSGPAPSPAAADPASEPPQPPSELPAGPSASASAARPALAGDETLERMFAEIAKDGSVAAKLGAPKAAASKPEQDVGETPPGSTPVVIAEPQPAAAPEAGEPGPAPASAPAPDAAAAKPATQAKPAAKAQAEAKSKAKAKAQTKAETKAKPAPKPKPMAGAKPASVAVSGDVVRVVAEDKRTEYVLLIQTSRPPAHFQKLFIADPPRMVLDLAGAWRYSGPTSRVTGENFIRQIRIGRHADMFRVVLDMAPDALSKLRGTPTVDRVPEGVVLKIPK